ncbi:TPA: hypothetical protein SI716_001719 [Staphylococcus aureus]|nr:hypothetical protein [Staphylococcus aureus]
MKNYVIYMLLLILATVFIGVLTDLFIAFAIYGIMAVSGLALKNSEVI